MSPWQRPRASSPFISVRSQGDRASRQNNQIHFIWGRNFDPYIKKQEGKKVEECGRIFMSDSQDMVQAKNTFYDDISEPILFFLHLSPGPEHISSGIPAIFRHLFKPDNIFFNRIIGLSVVLAGRGCPWNEGWFRPFLWLGFTHPTSIIKTKLDIAMTSQVP